VPAGAVIQKLNFWTAWDTSKLEGARGWWNARCRGEIRWYRAEHQKRRHSTGATLTLRNESVGIKKD